MVWRERRVIVEHAQRLRVLEILGIDPGEEKRYTIRLNYSLFGMSPIDAFYDPNKKQELIHHISRAYWPNDKRHHYIQTERVLEFVQLEPRDKTRFLFVGGYQKGDYITSELGDEYYQLESISQFEPFAGRLIASYRRGAGYTGMDFNLSNNENRAIGIRENMTVEKITASRLDSKPFPGYDQVRLNFQELCSVIISEEWRTALGAVQGIYLQTDLSNGWHYVGSAYSQGGEKIGILSRWAEYASGDHTGGNDLLRAIPDAAEHIERYFQYSILEVFDMKADKDDIINREHWWMHTLSSIRSQDDLVPHGYNTF